MSKNTVTVTVDLDHMADQVVEYYNEMQEGQIAEMFGDQDKAFLQAKKVVGLMAHILEDAVGEENVVKVNKLAAAKQEAQLKADEAANS